MKGPRGKAVNYDEALETAFNLSPNPAALEAFLASIPAWRGQIAREVRLAHTIGQELSTISPSAAGAIQRQQELIKLVARLGTGSERVSRSRLAGLLTALAWPRLLASATIATALVALAVVVGLPTLNGSGPAKAEAVVIEGRVAEIGAGGVTISTANSAELVQFSSDTVLTDGFGNALQPSALNTGQTVILTGSRSAAGVVVSQVELKDRLFGTVTALTSDSIRLRTGQNERVIAVTSDTEIEATVRVGAYVEVKVLRLADGGLRALEIETEAEESDDGEDGHDSSSTPTSVLPTPVSTPAAGGSPGDDPKDEVEHEAEDDHQDEVEHPAEDQPEDSQPKDGEDHEDAPSEPEDEPEHD